MAGEAEPPLLQIENASVMRGDSLVLDRFSLTVAAGQHMAILGPNGSGKSTFVKLIARQLYPVAGGSVRVFGRERWHVQELRGLLGIVSPSVQDDFTGAGEGVQALEVFDAVASGFFGARGLWRQMLTPPMREASLAALEQIGASRLIGRDMASLSTGEARRVLIARALVHRPRALLLDEPCSGLDPASRQLFLESLRTLARGGTTLLMVTHHVEEILPEIGHVAMLAGGRLLQAGEKAALLTAPVLTRLFGAPMQVERHGDWYSARAGAERP